MTILKVQCHKLNFQSHRTDHHIGKKSCFISHKRITPYIRNCTSAPTDCMKHAESHESGFGPVAQASEIHSSCTIHYDMDRDYLCMHNMSISLF